MSHPDAETLAAFAEGRLPAAERTALVAHLDTCEECFAQLELANETIHAEGGGAKRPTWTWLAVAAAAAIVIAGAATFFLRPRSPESRLVAAAPRSERAVEARLTGGFPWATYRGTARASQTAADPEALRLA
ncbi:MAG TPA: zf-HC2 domain-containing protein, partial [Thermoanaerobaculia bacterium]|nr:zf-HC2 domain-containing protein [Thermoanaerobaculia bacterium]